MGRARWFLLLFLAAAAGWTGGARAAAGGEGDVAERCDTALRAVLADGPWSGADSVAFDWTLPPLRGVPAPALIEAEALQLRERGTCTVALRLLDQGRILRRLTVPVRVRRWEHLPVARRDLPRGRVLEEGDVEERWVETTHLAGGDLMPLGEVLGRRLARPLGAGRALPGRLLESVPDVRRGESLVLTVRSGGVSVSARAEALEDALIGQTFKVRLFETGRRMAARLTADGQALVEVGG
ncbi:MAG: flagellar basal body P-ring formation chaperone FlgA [bacterium]|nr:flagellar basal body P-ring formation chaperone FlgA [bacterium]